MWQPFETAPKDGTRIFVAKVGSQWPEVIQWELYCAEHREEIGQDGYWRFSDELLCEADCDNPHDWTHWQPLPAMPTT